VQDLFTGLMPFLTLNNSVRTTYNSELST